MESVLQLENIVISFDTPQGEVKALRGVDLSLAPGEILAIVGESGCGKTVLRQSVLKLLPKTARIKSGSMKVCGKNITHYKEKQMRGLRGSVLSMAFQDPMTSLNSTIPIIETVKENGLDPYRYLIYILRIAPNSAVERTSRMSYPNKTRRSLYFSGSCCVWIKCRSQARN